MEIVRKGIVFGGGIISEAHVSGLRKAGVEVVAIIDPEPKVLKRAQENYQIPNAYTTSQEAMHLKPDIACIGTPNMSHAQLAIDLMNTGIHVICEKPMARTVEECDSMILTSHRTGKKLFIAHSMRFAPQHQKMIQLVKENAIGRPFMAISTFIGNEYNRMNDPKNWKGTWDISGGGAVIDNGVHMIDLLCATFGPVAYVEAVSGRLVIDANKAEDTAIITLGYMSGVVASLAITFAARFSTYPVRYVGAGIRTEVFGTEGAIYSGNDKSVPELVMVTNNDKRIEINATDIRCDTSDNPFEHFVNCLRNGTESFVSMEDGRNNIAIVMAIYQSTRDNCRVYLNQANLYDKKQISC